MSIGPNIDVGDGGGGDDSDTSDSSDTGTTGPEPEIEGPDDSTSGTSGSSGGSSSGSGSSGSSSGSGSSGSGSTDETTDTGTETEADDSTGTETETGDGSAGTGATGPGPDLEAPGGETVTQDEADAIRRGDDIRETVGDVTGGHFGGSGSGSGTTADTSTGTGSSGEASAGDGSSDPVGSGGLAYVGWGWDPTSEQREAAAQAEAVRRTGNTSTPVSDLPGETTNLTPDQREQVLDRYLAEAESSLYSRDDLVVRQAAGGDYLVVPDREAVRRETAEQLLDQVGGDYDRDDVVFSFDEEARLRATLSSDAVRREAAEDYLAQLGDGRFDVDDVVVQRDDEGNLTASLSEEALDEARLDRELGTTGTPEFAAPTGAAYESTELIAERTPRASESQSLGTTGTPGFVGTPSPDEARRRAEGVAASDRNLYEAELEERIREAGGDPDDYSIEWSQVDGGFEASVELTGDPSAGPVAGYLRDITDDPAADFRAGVFERREAAEAWIQDRTADVEDEFGVEFDVPDELEAQGDAALASAQDTGRDVWTAATIVPRVAAGAGRRASESNLVDDRDALVGAAAAGVFAPEPATSAAGGAVLLGVGAAAGIGYLGSELDVGEDDRTELEVPEEERTTEIPAPTEPVQDEGELDPAGAATDVTELPVGDPTVDDTEPGTLQTGTIVDQPGGETGLPTPVEPSIGGYEEPTVTEDDVVDDVVRRFPTGESAVVGLGDDYAEPEVTIDEAAEADLTGETATGVETALPGQAAVPGAAAGIGAGVGAGFAGAFGSSTPTSTATPFAGSLATPALQEFDTPTADAYPNEFAEPFEFGPGFGYPVGYGFGNEPIRPNPEFGGRDDGADTAAGLGGFGGGADDELGPGWFAETVTTIATRGTEPVESPDRGVLKELAGSGQELPTQAFVSDDPTEREAAEAAYGLFTGGAAFGFGWDDGSADEAADDDWGGWL